MSSRVIGEGGGVVVTVCVAVVLTVEIPEKSQISVQAQKKAVKAGTFSGPFFLPVLVLYCCGSLAIRACVLAYEQSLSEGRGH
jgi:hypothetical protein